MTYFLEMNNSCRMFETLIRDQNMQHTHLLPFANSVMYRLQVSCYWVWNGGSPQLWSQPSKYLHYKTKMYHIYPTSQNSQIFIMEAGKRKQLHRLPITLCWALKAHVFFRFLYILKVILKNVLFCIEGTWRD